MAVRDAGVMKNKLYGVCQILRAFWLVVAFNQSRDAKLRDTANVRSMQFDNLIS